MFDERLQNDTVNSLKNEIEQWRNRYNYVLSENSILSRQKSELEAEVFNLKTNYAFKTLTGIKKKICNFLAGKTL